MKYQRASSFKLRTMIGVLPGRLYAIAFLLLMTWPAAVFAEGGPGGQATAARSPAFPSATPESQGLSQEALAQVAAKVRSFVEKDNIIGAELLVIKNRRVVLHETHGLKDKERGTAMQPDSIFCIRSMTKPIVGVAVQMLIDEGKLSLDDKVAKYLPSFDNDKSRHITVRHLLTQTSGLPLSSSPRVSYAKFTSLRDSAYSGSIRWRLIFERPATLSG